MHAARAVWAQRHLWVTQYADGELYPAGNYPLQLEGGIGGIDSWTQADRNIKDDDVVLWHSVGITHVIRIEDFPVMPVELCMFHLKPVNFFDMNPALDLPPTVDTVSKEDDGECCARPKM